MYQFVIYILLALYIYKYVCIVLTQPFFFSSFSVLLEKSGVKKEKEGKTICYT